MSKLAIPLLLILTLSGCAHQLFEDTPEDDSSPINSEGNISQPTNPKPARAGVPQTPHKRVITKNPSGDAYND